MTLRVGLVGLGYFAGFHAEAWRRIDGAELFATCDVDPARGADHRRVADLLATRPDIVDIASPPRTHAGIVRAALEIRPSAIICQKPFCTSLEEAAATTEAAEAAAIPLVIHENFRFQPWFRTIKAALDAGDVGRPLTFLMRMRTGDGRGPDAYRDRQPYFRDMRRFLVHETGVHYLDTFRFLFGDPDGVYADLRRLNPAIRGEDAGHVILDYGSGMRAVLDANRVAHAEAADPRLTFGDACLEGDAATVRLHGDGRVTLRASGAREDRTLLPARAYPGFAGDCVHALQGHVVSALRGRGVLENEARSYLDVMRLVDLCYASDAAKTRLPAHPVR